MKSSTKRRLYAMLLLVFYIKLFRYQGYYGVSPLIPWWEAIVGSVLFTILTLRLIVISRRWF